MKRRIVSLPGPKSKLPLSPGVIVGNLLFTSGQVGVNKTTKETPTSVGEQTQCCFDNLKPILEAAGLGMEDVAKVNVYLTDMSDFPEMNKVYKEQFPDDPPARTTVGISGLAMPEYKVEIEMIAVVPD